MKNLWNVKQAGRKVTAAVLAACVLMTGAMTVNVNADAVSGDVGITRIAEDGMVEHYIDADQLENITIVYDSAADNGISLYDGHAAIDWTVNPYTRHVTSGFRVYAGGRINASSIVTPRTQTYWLGVMDDDGHAWYVSGSGSLGHAFNISTTNDYRVFIQNNSGAILSAVGSYSYVN